MWGGDCGSSRGLRGVAQLAIEHSLASSQQTSGITCVLAFNISEGWSRDVTGDVARDVSKRAISEKKSLPDTVRDFIEHETGKNVKSPV
jgi:hypothetical protein